MKRLIDFLCSFFFFLSFPVHFFLVKKPASFFKNCFDVLTGKKTWVGYFHGNGPLPPMKPGVLGANGMEKNKMNALPETSVRMIDHWYAKNYVPWHDLRIIFGRYKHLGAE